MKSNQVLFKYNTKSWVYLIIFLNEINIKLPTTIYNNMAINIKIYNYNIHNVINAQHIEKQKQQKYRMNLFMNEHFYLNLDEKLYQVKIKL